MFRYGYGALVVGTLLWLPETAAQSDRPGRTVSAVFGNPGDHWADAMPHGHIGRATRDEKYGYEVDFRGDDGCGVTIFWPRDKIDFRGERPRYRLMKRRVTSGWFWYPDKLTVDSLPKVYKWVMEIEADYQRQADAAIAGANGFLLVAGVGALVPAPRVPPPPARAGAVTRSPTSAARARPSSSATHVTNGTANIAPASSAVQGTRLRAQLAAERIAGARLPQQITGYTKHGLNQAISRDGVGVSTRAIMDAFNHPISIAGQSGGRFVLTGRNAVVVVNAKGEVITAWATNSAGFRVAP